MVHTLLFSTCAEALGLKPSPSWLDALNSHASETTLLPETVLQLIRLLM